MNNNTPDTEWEKEFDEKFNKAFCCDHDHYGEECGKEFATKCKSFIKKTLTSRDTYWKERVRKEIDICEDVLKGSAGSKSEIEGAFWHLRNNLLTK